MLVKVVNVAIYRRGKADLRVPARQLELREAGRGRTCGNKSMIRPQSASPRLFFRSAELKIFVSSLCACESSVSPSSSTDL